VIVNVLSRTAFAPLPTLLLFQRTRPQTPPGSRCRSRCAPYWTLAPWWFASWSRAGPTLAWARWVL